MIIIICGTLLMAFKYDAPGTAKLLARAMSIGGVTWITEKTIRNVDHDTSQIIRFAGWSMAGVSMVGIVSNAVGNINNIKMFFMRTSMAVDKFADLIDKIMFWK